MLAVPSTAFALPTGTNAPVLDVQGPVVAFYAGTAEVDGSTTLEPTTTGSKSRLDCTILFGKDSDVLRSGAKERLRRLSDQLRAQGAGRVAITGYTDDLGSAAHGLDLSTRRARRVAQELGRTLPNQQFPIAARGLGEAHPAVPNTSEANRRKNRRVVVTLTRDSATRPPATPARPASTPTRLPTPNASPAATAAPTPDPATASPRASTVPGAAPPPPAAPPTDTTDDHSAGLPWPWIGGIGAALVIAGVLLDRLRARQHIGRVTQGPSSPQGDTHTRPSPPGLPEATSSHDGETADHARPKSRPEDALRASTTTLANAALTGQAMPFAGDLSNEASAPAALLLRASESTLASGLAASLAADLAAWQSPNSHRPRLSVLGPVHARTHGKALARRRPYYTELFAYLTLRPSGATVDDLADTFDITPARVRTDMKILRDWLGTNPDTGNPYLPDARTTPAALRRGTAVYQLDGTLCDWHLFTRLQAAAARADEGERVGHLQAALDLVTGRAFDQLRPTGWNWLLEGDRVDLHAAKATSDVAVELLVHHQAQQDEDATRTALEMLSRVDPDKARELSRARS